MANTERFVYSSKKDNIPVASFEKIGKYATSNGTKHLELSVRRQYGICSIPNSVLSSSSLRTLKLKGTGRYPITINTQLCLKQLESLHLEGLDFEVSDIFSKCENLVDLSIVDCEMLLKSVSTDLILISAPRLERLSISSSFPTNMSEFVFSLPKLTSLNFRAGGYHVFRTDKLLHLKTARIDFGSPDTSISDNEDRVWLSRIAMNMVNELFNAQHVYLSMPTFELLHVIAGTMEVSPVQFANLKTLTIVRKKHTSKLIPPHKHIPLSVINQVMSSILQYPPNVDVGSIIEHPRRVRSSW